MKIKKIIKVNDTRFLNMFEISYQDMCGADRSWQMVSRHISPKCMSGAFDIPDAVVIVPYHREEGMLVIIKEFRVPLGDYQYGFPAGLVDKGESVSDAAIRELLEETGLRVTQIFHEGPPVYSSTGITDESVSMIYVECDGTPSRAHNESSEDIETILVSPSDAISLCENRELKFDVKTFLIMSVFAKTGKVIW